MKCSCNCNKIKETKIFQDTFAVSLQNYFFFTEYPRLLCKIVVHCFNGFYVVFFSLLFGALVGGKKNQYKGLWRFAYQLSPSSVSCLKLFGELDFLPSPLWLRQATEGFLNHPVIPWISAPTCSVFYNSLLTLRDVDGCFLSWNACICLPEVHSSRSKHRILLDCSYLT